MAYGTEIIILNCVLFYSFDSEPLDLHKIINKDGKTKLENSKPTYNQKEKIRRWRSFKLVGAQILIGYIT